MKMFNKAEKALVRTYLIGFGLSFGITIVAFTAAFVQAESDMKAFPAHLVLGGLVLLAIAQLIVQLLFFFHLGKESKPRLNTTSFLFMLMVVGIIAFGSLWIMYNLNYNMMPGEVEQYIQKEENIFREKPDTHHHH